MSSCYIVFIFGISYITYFFRNIGHMFSYIVGNKEKGRISKWMFEENKGRQIFPENEHFLPPDTHIFPYLVQMQKIKCVSNSGR